MNYIKLWTETFEKHLNVNFLDIFATYLSTTNALFYTKTGIYVKRL